MTSVTYQLAVVGYVICRVAGSPRLASLDRWVDLGLWAAAGAPSAATGRARQPGESQSSHEPLHRQPPGPRVQPLRVPGHQGPLRHRPVRADGRRHGARCAHRDPATGRRSGRRILRRRRSQSAGVRSGDALGDAAPVLRGLLPCLARGGVVPPRSARVARWLRCAGGAALGGDRDAAGQQSGPGDVRHRDDDERGSARRGNRRATAAGRAHAGQGLGRPRWCSPSRTRAPTSAPG